MIGRSKVGLIETDIDDLTATTTGRAEVLAAAERKDVARSLAKHSDGVLAELLVPQETATLPTVRPVCFHEISGTNSGTAGQGGGVSSPKRAGFDCSFILQHNKKGNSNRIGMSAAAKIAAVRLEGGLETSERVRVLGANETQHRKNVGDNLRRLRVLLGKPKDHPETRRAGSPSLFSVHELRTIEAARARRRRPDGPGPAGAYALAGDSGADWNVVEEQGGGQQRPTAAALAHREGPAAELAVGGNHLLRNLAKALFVSMQNRIQKELLSLSFRKWEVRQVLRSYPTGVA